MVADPASRIVLIDLKDGWLGGVDLEEAVRACDGIILCCYDMGAEQIEKTIRDARSRLPADKYVGLGLSLFYSPREIEGRIRRPGRCRKAGRGGRHQNFYNYGLIPQKRLEWIGAALAR